MRRRRRRWPARLAHCARSFVAFLFSNVGITLLVLGYIIAGAFMFQAIEGASEIERGNQMAREREETAQYLWEITNDINLFNETALKHSMRSALARYQGLVVRAVRRGWDGGRHNTHWSFSSAFLYSLTVITTIGYGHISPRTKWGKVTTVFYSLLGMPIFLLYLANIGSLLARWFKCLYALVCLCRGCPGFSRRRVIRHRSQLEMSEAESIERPEGWQSDSDVSRDHRIPPEYGNSHLRQRQGDPLELKEDSLQRRELEEYRIFPYHGAISKEYRIPSYQREISKKYSKDLNDRPRLKENRISVRNREISEQHRIPSYRRSYPGRCQHHRYDAEHRSYSVHDRQDRSYSKKEYSRQRDTLDNRLPNRLKESYQSKRFVPNEMLSREYDAERHTRQRQETNIPNYRFPGVYEGNASHRFQMDREKPQSRFSTERYRPDFAERKRYFQRYSAYNRSTSMPQPISMHAIPHDVGRSRGWSEPVMWRNDNEESSEFSFVTFDAQTITVPISVCVAVMVSYIFFGSILFGLWEKWDQLDGAYFCFISLSSIGFGDFVPGERIYTPRIETSFIVCSLYLMFGMALVAMCFNLMQEQVIHYVDSLKRAVKRMCRCRR